MLKGVNKTVIEVNNLNSKVFTKAIFFVNPQCYALSGKRLKKEAIRLTDNLGESGKNVSETLNVLFGSRKKTAVFLAVGGLIISAAIIIMLLI